MRKRKPDHKLVMLMMMMMMIMIIVLSAHKSRMTKTFER